MKRLKDYDRAPKVDSLQVDLHEFGIREDFKEGLIALQGILDFPISSHNHGECLLDVTQRLVGPRLRNEDEIRGAKAFLEWFIKC